MKKRLEILEWLISYRSLSYSSEQNRLMKDLFIKYGGKFDKGGNLILIKGNPKIAIVAHADINQPKGSCELIKSDVEWYSLNTVGCGFDDKAGLAFALWYFENYNDIQIIITINEEVGCIGASAIILDPFIEFLVQLDRRGYSDISDYTNGINVVNDTIKPQLSDILDNFGFSWHKCVYTDIGEIAKNNKVQAVNISTGYYNEHTSDEYLDIPAYNNSCLFAVSLINKLKTIHIDKLIFIKDEIRLSAFDNFLDFEEKEDNFFKVAIYKINKNNYTNQFLKNKLEMVIEKNGVTITLNEAEIHEIINSLLNKQ